MEVARRRSRQVSIGPLKVGGDAPIRVESMLKSGYGDEGGMLRELEALAACGCELVRISLPSHDQVEAFRRLVSRSPLPVMADVHFDHRLAIAAVESGASSIRINPGNLGPERLKEVVEVAAQARVPLRIGANSGSLSRRHWEAGRGDEAMSLVSATMEHVLALEELGFQEMIISAKSTDPMVTLRANLELSKLRDYPAHIGVTEAGLGKGGLIKSAVGIALMLYNGVGDTIRVSLTAPSVEEVEAGYWILQSMGLRRRYADVVSCPTCSRRRIDLSFMGDLLSFVLPMLPPDVTFAIMGCEVNGPQEASSADLGIAGTAGGVVVFRRGKAVARFELDGSSLEDLKGFVEAMLSGVKGE